MTPTLGEDFADGQQKQKQHAETLENVEPTCIYSMTPAIWMENHWFSYYLSNSAQSDGTIRHRDATIQVSG